MGLGFPLSKTGDPKDKKLANEIIHGGLMAELFTGELLVLMSSSCSACICILLTAGSIRLRSCCCAVGDMLMP